MSGRIQIVATPIGNLGDLSERARRAFAEADVVACEDTRRTGQLLAHLGIKKRLLSLHEHNERRRLDAIFDLVAAGQTVVLASDAGTPLLCDPGYVLIREAIAREVAVEAIPGPSAMLAALVASGLPPHPFTFAGFPPPRSGRRRRFFRQFAGLEHTLIFYESPHRLLGSLRDARLELGERPACVARELTKLHEEVLRGGLESLLLSLEARDRIRGEFVVVVGGCTVSRGAAEPASVEGH